MDETDIFKGHENPLHLRVEHTHFFTCKFQLQFFPFDTQVFFNTRMIWTNILEYSLVFSQYQCKF